MKTAILGGSFDPVHLGHLYLLHNAVTQTDYSRFILIPAKVSNFKLDSRPVSTDVDRMNMLRLALEDFHELYPSDGKHIEISDIELKRGGISYTYDTVMQIKKQYELQDRIGLIVGDDHMESLEKWHRFNELVNEVEFIVCPRNSVSGFTSVPDYVNFRLLDVPETRMENSTSVRNNIDQYGQYLSKRVLNYARERNLYR